jgi:XRE family transcriptional regulator|nr:MAG TPA: putative zinc finger/helix-turn-helix protein, YgiT family [Caudoviricetes sp.]
MIDNMELGYTPNNLRSIRAKYGLTQKQVAKITGLKTWHPVNRWEAPVEAAYHADMPHTKWLKLMDELSSRKANNHEG